MKMVTSSIEHAFYINVHLIDRPDQWLNFSLYFGNLSYCGTAQLWVLLNREVQRIANEKDFKVTEFQKNLIE